MSGLRTIEAAQSNGSSRPDPNSPSGGLGTMSRNTRGIGTRGAVALANTECSTDCATCGKPDVTPDCCEGCAVGDGHGGPEIIPIFTNRRPRDTTFDDKMPEFGFSWTFGKLQRLPGGIITGWHPFGGDDTPDQPCPDEETCKSVFSHWKSRHDVFELLGPSYEACVQNPTGDGCDLVFKQYEYLLDEMVTDQDIMMPDNSSCCSAQKERIRDLMNARPSATRGWYHNHHTGG